jgi:5S rRNA maturation endonuclease (ribonuclease M5)
LSTRIEKKEERLQQILEKIAEANANRIPIIVEGRKDEGALRTLGVTGEIIAVKTGGRSLLRIIQTIEERQFKEVILLLDFDRRGRETAQFFKNHLERARITPNLKFWAQLARTVGKEVKDIEGLVAYMETLKRKLSSNPQT